MYGYIPCVSLWGPQGSSSGPRATLAERHRKHKRFSQSIWGRAWGSLGVSAGNANDDISSVLAKCQVFASEVVFMCCFCDSSVGFVYQ